MTKATVNPEASELETKVDAMMSLDTTTTPPASTPIDIFDGQPAPTEAPSDATPVATAGAPLLPSTHHKAVTKTVATAPAAIDVVAPTAAAPAGTIDADDILIKPLAIDTPQSDAAIQDIVTQEADAVLAAQDAGLEAAAEDAESAAPASDRRRGHPIIWFVVFVLALLVILGAALLLQPGLSFAP